MSITGSLTDFSTPEILRFIEKGQKTGLLSFAMCLPNRTKPQSVHHLWVQSGRIVAAANSLDAQGLVFLIAQQEWLSDRVFAKLLKCCCPEDQPLGSCLKNHGVLSPSQLEQLFQVQVLQQVCPLFEYHEGWFKFEKDAPVPNREMTGLSIPATEAILMGLRWLPNWNGFKAQFPAPTVTLVSKIVGPPGQQLDRLESQVWQLSQQAVSLNAIAKELKLPVSKVQQVAFRLMVADLLTLQEKPDPSHSPSDAYPLEIALSYVIG